MTRKEFREHLNQKFPACLYVNARDGIQNADITNLRWSGKTVKGAEKWAKKQLS